MAKLTTTGRTILKSRLRRHNDALVISQHISGAYGASNVSTLTTDQLIETAQKVAMALPGMVECSAFDTSKSLGKTTNDCLAAADYILGTAARSWSLVTSSPVAAVLGVDLGNDDEPDAPGVDEDETPVQTIEPVQSGVDVDTDGDKKAIDDEVKAVMALMGAGDFAGYQARLRSLATEARKPAKVIEVTTPDYSKIKGRVPQVVGKKTMREAGIVAPSNLKAEATALNVYDAPNAPKVDPDYKWHDQTDLVLSAAQDGEPMFLFGPAGTGKTELAKQIAARYGRPFVRISCDDQTEAQTLVGMTVPAAGGGSQWQDGQLAAAIRIPGAVILVDEPSIARPGALFVLQAVMDGDKRIHVAETGEVIPLARDVVLLLADNTNGTGDTSGAHEGTRRLNRATLDRPAGFIRFDYLSPLDEAVVIHRKTGLDKKSCAAIVKFAALTRAKAGDGKLSYGVGLRRLLSLAKYLAKGCEPNMAYQVAVIDGAAYDDQEPLRQFWVADADVKTLRTVTA